MSAEYLGAPRFAVRELTGYVSQGDGRALGSHVLEGLTVTVIDRAYCATVIHVRRSEDLRGGRGRTREMRLAMLRREAGEVAAELNERHGA